MAVAELPGGASGPVPRPGRRSGARRGRAARGGEPGHGRKVSPARWSLRARLIALLMVLLATASMAIVFVTAVALRGVLINQLDHQLVDTSRRWGRDGIPGLPPAGAGLLPGSGYGGGYGSGYGTGSGSGTGSGDSSDSDRGTGGATGSGSGTTTSVTTTTTAAQNALDELDGTALVNGFFRGPVDPGTLAAVIDGSTLYGATYDSSTNALQSVTDGEAVTIAAVPRDGNAYTRTIGGDEYRIISTTRANGTTVVTALPMAQVNATLTKMTVIGGVVALVGVAATAIAGTIIIRVTLRPLRRVAATASRVAELPLERGEVALSVRVAEVDTDPRTEVGQVGAALNQMLGHIGNALAVRHASETRMRQFLADVSHELRTPLAAISGYAELTRRTREPVPPDVTYAMSRVESESARMTSLVSDLLLLARIDSGRPLEHESVDLSDLVVHAVSDAHVAAPDHRFSLDLPEEPVSVTGDAARLHQVLANLLANARTHTPPGTLVTASLSATATDAIIAVVDNGPGIAAELLPQIFERFARGDSSRSRAAGSTGLGLAIVAAVIEAHHGRVEASSVPGRTAFVVRLPRASSDASLPISDGSLPISDGSLPISDGSALGEAFGVPADGAMGAPGNGAVGAPGGGAVGDPMRGAVGRARGDHLPIDAPTGGFLAAPALGHTPSPRP
ncbi:HAMP domain-containing histidine kinase [Frankia sp. AgPm24]|uniref:sensor histidine kinase n=1 Tax=Frankia sp. AgPm24 TaxID=631128 RepID=UPI00200E144A|nr:HAMP domain-containing sensor histidine kinase [Frankia sp. AgPm24]MCK9921139.1 HAMP domain-containing histidine kinase [Frankia sp. AgPm24]